MSNIHETLVSDPEHVSPKHDSRLTLILGGLGMAGAGGALVEVSHQDPTGSASVVILGGLILAGRGVYEYLQSD